MFGPFRPTLTPLPKWTIFRLFLVISDFDISGHFSCAFRRQLQLGIGMGGTWSLATYMHQPIEFLFQEGQDNMNCLADFREIHFLRATTNLQSDSPPVAFPLRKKSMDFIAGGTIFCFVFREHSLAAAMVSSQQGYVTFWRRARVI